MRMKPHDEDDGYRVWLSRDELDRLIDKMHDRGGTMHRLAGRLGADAGLRRDESASTRPIDVQESHGDVFIRVWEDQAKMEKYRETPIPADLADQIQMIPEFRDDINPDDPVIPRVPKTLNRWVKRAGEALYAETGDEAWLEVRHHDLRRSWGTGLLEQGVLPSVVMSWGGWDDWETFRRHYLGEFSPEALARERGKVTWLATRPPEERPDADSAVHPAVTPSGTNYSGSKPY